MFLTRRHLGSRALRSAFMTGVSALALLTASPAPVRALQFASARSGASSATANAAAAALASAQQAQAVSQQMTSDLLRAAQAVQSVQQAQIAARAAAQQQTGSVANGLAPGGLVVDPRVAAGSDPNLWQNISAPIQTTSNGQTIVTLTQSAQRAIATWEQFNVGRNTTVDFDQSGGNSANGNSWIVLNRIDATGVPSQIQGQIKADGTVLIINPNGIVFSGTSQVNVHTLIASTLDIDSFSGTGVTNVGVFGGNTGESYVPITVDGITQKTPDGTTILAPPEEDSANQTFLSSGLYINNVNANGVGTLVMAQGIAGSQANQGVIVAPGAQISTDISGFDNGGTVALLGTSVDNAGSISTPSGQIILAAGPNIFLEEPSGSNTSFAVSTLTPGSNVLLAFDGAGLSDGSPTTNEVSGLLSAPDGNVTMFGDVVNQLGVAAATTSVTRAGSLTFTADRQLNFGAASVSSILPDENGETIPGSSTISFVGPSINIAAANVDMQGDAGDAPGSLIVAPSAAMNVSTGVNPTVANGRFLQESGSIIDLAGLDAAASILNYIFTFKVTSNDVADSPLAQSLIGQTVTIDLTQSGTRSDGLTWVGSPLFSATGAGYLGEVAQSIDQLLTKGGSLTFAAGSLPFTDVIEAPGSLVNLSGGFTTFAGAKVATTELVTALGQIVNIADADPFMPVDGIAGQFVVDHAHWGVAETFTSALLSHSIFDPGFIAGASAGGLSITAANPILEGTLLGATVTGSRQAELAESDTGPNGSQATIDQLPQDASLTISLVTVFGAAAPNAVVLQSGETDVLGPDFGMDSTLNLPSLKIVTGESPTGPVTSNVSVLTFSTDALSASDLGAISISGSSDLSMSQGAALSVQAGGSIKFTGVSTIDGTLTAHGGSISLTGFTGGTLVSDAPPVSQVTIGPDALIDVSGLFVNDTGATLDNLQGDAHINGGSVSIQTDLESNSTSVGFTGGSNIPPVVDVTQSIVLVQGSVVDVSSGGYVQPNGQIKLGANSLPVGNGGNLSLITYAGNNAGWANPANPNFNGSPPSNVAPNDGNLPNQADVFMNGTIFSAGLNDGGTFALQAPIIQIGGVESVTSTAATGTVALPATFFSSNGFSAYALTSTYGSTTVLPGTNVPLRQENYLDLPVALPASGARVRDFAALGLAPFGMRDPVSLTLAETPFPYGGTNDVSTNAGVLIGAGATIEGEPGASIDLTAAGPVTVLGSLIAPGDSITLDNDGVPLNFTQLAQGQNVGVVTQAPLDVWIGADAVLDVDGAFLPNLTASPLLSTGSVLNGGSITLQGGTIVALPGSQFDLTGTSATIQNFGLVPSLHNHLTEQPIWSDGGTLTIEGSSALANGTSGEFQAAYFDGTVDAAGGAPEASGGTLTIAGLDGPVPLFGAIVVSQNGNVTGAFNTAALAGQSVPATAQQLAALLPSTNSVVAIGENTLNNSGFDSVNLLASTIAFSGNVSVKVPDQLVLAGNLTLLPAGNMNPNFTAASIGGTVVTIEAGDLLLASNSFVAPVLSDGTLNLDAAAQIDLAGFPSVSNAGHVNLTSGGDIRLLSDTDAEFANGIFVQSYFGSLLQFLSGETSESILQSPGVLAVPDDLTLTAREVYPTSESAFLLMSAGLGSGATANTITIASDGETPVTPLSIGGEIVVDAANIIQDGALEAPLGTILLGLTAGQQFPSAFSTDIFNVITFPAPVTTQSVVLASGSLTSVSAIGIDVPFGTTINDANFSVIGANILAGESGTTTNPPLTEPPAKAIQLSGATIDSQAGAVLDLSGGGDFFATEFVPGSGGSHNVLTETGGQQVFALVPSFEAPVAPNDPTQGALIAPGTSVTLPGGHGVAGGTYILLPAIYATMPGAFRVVVTATNATLANTNFVEPDGSILMAGTLGNSITGARSSSTALLEIQSQAVWTKYSEIDKTSADIFFANLAAANGTQTPMLPIDAGQLVLNATSALTLLGTNNFTPAPGGRGGEADITGNNILVLAPDQTEAQAEAAATAAGIPVPAGGFIILNSDQISDLGAESVLIGGVRSQESDGSTLITPVATAVLVDTDAAHPLSAPDLLMVANPTAGQDVTYLTVDIFPFTYVAEIPSVATGTGRISIVPGSVVEAKGAVSSTQPQTLHLGRTVAPLPATIQAGQLTSYFNYNAAQEDAAGAYVLQNANPVTSFYNQAFSGGGLAALLQVSNGAPAVVERNMPSVPATLTVIGGGGSPSEPNLIVTPPPLPAATISVAASAELAGNALNLNSSNISIADTAVLSSRNMSFGASVINLGDAPAGGPGLTLTPSLVAQFAGTQSVTLSSSSVFNLYDTGGVSLGDAQNPISTLIFDGAGLFSAGGTTTITADNVTFTDSQATPNTAGAIAGSGGTLIVNANADASGTLGISNGQVVLGGEGQVDFNAASQILFAGSGSLDAGAAAVTLEAPEIVTSVASVQSLTTTGMLNLLAAAGTAPSLSPFDIGGALSLTGGSIDDAGAITALGGSITLTATSGDIVLAPGANISATGSHIILFDLADDAPGGTVKLIANSGNVTIDPGATIDVAATGDGFAGSLTIQTPGTATLDGTLLGSAAFADLGGNFTLNAGTLAGSLPLNGGFSGSFDVTLQQGDITIAPGTSLTSGNVNLTANAGNVVVDGTINASGTTGGSIELFGASSVTVGASAQLLANYQADDPSDPNFGNGESTLVQTGGTIELGTAGTPDGTFNSQFGFENVDSSGAIDVAQGAIFDVSGGAGGANINNAGGTVLIRVPILTNGNVNVSFKGSVDSGTGGEGVVLDAFAVWSTTDTTSGGQHFDGIVDPAGWFTSSGTQVAGTTTDGDIFTPNAGAVNQSHVTFYQTTLVDFVQNPFNSAAIANDFAGSSGVVLGSTLHLRPEIDLINPSTSINGGNVTVASNWNLGAGSFTGPNGSFAPFFRTTVGPDAGEPGVLALAAANNVQIKATISDGFFEPNDPFSSTVLPSGTESLATALNGTNDTNGFNNQQSFNLTSAETFGGLAGLPGMPSGQLTPPPTASQFPAGWNLADEEVYYGEIYKTYLAAIIDLGSSGSSGIATNPAVDFRTIGASGTTFDNNPADYPSYAAYIAAFNVSYVGSNLPSTATMASFVGSTTAALIANFVNDPNAAAYGGNYQTYQAAYLTYATDYATFETDFYNANPTLLVPTLPAPIPPGAFNPTTGVANNYFINYQSYAAAYEQYAVGAFEGRPTQDQVEPGNVRPFSDVAHSPDSLWLVAVPFLPPPADTPNLNISVTPQAAGPGNAIANNPAKNGTLADLNTTSAASLMTAAISGQGSFSYNFVAGAQFTASGDLSADPDSVVAVPASVVTTGANAEDSVTVNGHTSFTNPNEIDFNTVTVDIPTLVRTGTGSIDIVAAGSVEMLDATAPGAIYTAGVAADPVAGFDAPTSPLVTNLGYQPTGLLSNPAWGVDGGGVIISAGSDIVGIETPVDSDGSQTRTVGMPTGEFWSAWYYVSGDAAGGGAAPFDPSLGGIQNSTWVNYGTFFQGVGALGGGNVHLKASADIDDISASLPETIQVSGGQSAGDPPVVHYFGGGDLTVQAGGNLNSSTFYVGRGTGTITVAGTVQADADNPVTGAATKLIPVTYSGSGNPTLGTAVALPLLLAVQDGFISVNADQSETLGAVFDPTRILFDTAKLGSELNVIGSASVPAGLGAAFDSFGPDSGIALSSVSGNVTLNTLPQSNANGAVGITDSLFVKTPNNPSNNQGNGADAPPVTGDGGGESTGVGPATVDALALIGNITLDNNLFLAPSPTGTLDLRAQGSISTLSTAGVNPVLNGFIMLDGFASASETDPPLINMLGAPTPSTLPQALHADDTTPAIVYAGDDITGFFDFIKPAKMEAGNDIINTEFIGQNNNASDVTSVIAGRDIVAEDTTTNLNLATSTFLIYGPGTFLIDAGRNLGPFFTSVLNSSTSDLPSLAGMITDSALPTGIFTVGDGSNLGDADVKPYLQPQGADTFALFGTGSGIDDQAAIDSFINPANAGSDQGINFLADIATQLGETPIQAWTTFQDLSPTEQGLLIDRAFLDELTKVSQAFNDPTSATFQNANQAYETISVLFPASHGFTNDNAATPVMVHTGDLSMARSLLETQTGGDINIIGPGGNITVGQNATDNSKPSQEGILTLQGGSIRTFTDGSVIVDQSRIFTEQGGDIDMFSANGDLNAGKGPKSSASFPPLTLICDVDGFCRVNPTGLVTGAGIGALLSVPGQNPDDSNVSLAAPHGIIDAGAAGIRVAGNLNLVALQVLNAFNIDVGGVAIGIPTAASPNIGALTSATNAAGAAQANLPAPAQHTSAQPSILIVEIEGYGGDDESEPVQAPQPEQFKKRDQRSQNLNSAVRIVGAGDLDDREKAILTEQEKQNLVQ